METACELLYWAANRMYWCVLGRWLWNLYRYGPGITSSGFWAGITDTDLCARLSVGSQVSDWYNLDRTGASYTCLALIDRSFKSFEVSVHSTLYIILAYVIVKMVLGALSRRRATTDLIFSLKQHGIMIPYHPK